MTATGSSSAVPTGAWGRPARLRPSSEPAAAGPVVDLRDAPIERPQGFRPTPPPPAPPGARVAQVPRRLGLTTRRRMGLEALIVVLLLAGLAAIARPPAPAPLTPQARWETTTANRMDALARDVAVASYTSSLSPALLTGLKADLTSVQAAGPPPDPAAAGVWNRAVHRVEAALAEAATRPASARSDLGAAGLELTALSGTGTGAGS